MEPEAAVDAVATTLERWDLELGDQYRVHNTDDGYRIEAAVEGVLLFEEVLDDAGRLLGPATRPSRCSATTAAGSSLTSPRPRNRSSNQTGARLIPAASTA